MLSFSCMQSLKWKGEVAWKVSNISKSFRTNQWLNKREKKCFPWEFSFGGQSKYSVQYCLRLAAWAGADAGEISTIEIETFTKYNQQSVCLELLLFGIRRKS